MATTDEPVEVTHVACEMCLKEVPISEAKVSEAADYFVHFCGVNCFEKWKNQGQKPAEPADTPAP